MGQINYKCNWNGIPVYVDPYMKENEILRGKKGNGQFLVTTEKVALVLQQQDRAKKLERILNGTQI